MSPRLALVALTLGLAAAGCDRGGSSPTPAAADLGAPVRFEDVTAAAGLRFEHHTGATGKKYMPETMGSGCAFLDVDNDGRQDALLVDSTRWPGAPGPAGRSRLFRNAGEGRFEDVTERFGLPENLYGMGVASGDVDNDGYVDVLLTALGGSRLLHNNHGRRFVDVTAASGLHTPGWPTSGAFLDYNRDGWLDLFVCHYVRWSPAEDKLFTLDGVHKAYARPDAYPGEACQLFENRNGRFVDVSQRAGVALPTAKALGVALCDFDRDGWIDLAVSNDTVPNFLFHNQGDGTFKEVAVQSGVAVAEAGMAKAGMGIDVADYDNSGQDSILITNFAGEQLSLYRRDGSGLFLDVAARVGVGTPSQRYLGFGAFFFDADLDGWQDILMANGHIQDDVSVRSSEVTYAEPALLFRGSAAGRFTDVTAQSGALATPRVARGAARADIDNDGDPDLLISTNGGPSVLLRQAGAPRHHWLRVRLQGTRSNRSAIGATVRVHAGALVQSRMVRSGSSYLSQSALPITFGLGDATQVSEIEIRWPNGNVESVPGPAVDREITLVER